MCYFLLFVLVPESVNLYLISHEITGLNPFSIALEIKKKVTIRQLKMIVKYKHDDL